MYNSLTLNYNSFVLRLDNNILLVINKMSEETQGKEMDELVETAELSRD